MQITNAPILCQKCSPTSISYIGTVWTSAGAQYFIFFAYESFELQVDHGLCLMTGTISRSVWVNLYKQLQREAAKVCSCLRLYSVLFSAYTMLFMFMSSTLLSPISWFHCLFILLTSCPCRWLTRIVSQERLKRHDYQEMLLERLQPGQQTWRVCANYFEITPVLSAPPVQPPLVRASSHPWPLRGQSSSHRSRRAAEATQGKFIDCLHSSAWKQAMIVVVSQG